MPELRFRRDVRRASRFAVAGALVLGLAAAGCGGEPAVRAVGEAAAHAGETSVAKTTAKTVAGGGSVIGGGCAASGAC